jgi:hypothetical protein
MRKLVSSIEDAIQGSLIRRLGWNASQNLEITQDTRIQRIHIYWSVVHLFINQRPACDLHRRPAIGPRNLVPAELLLSIGVANVSVDIVVVHDPAFDRIVVNTLSTRAVDIAMRLEHDGSTARKARFTRSIDLDIIISKRLTVCITIRLRLTKLLVADDDLQTLILYSAPAAGRLVS